MAEGMAFNQMSPDASVTDPRGHGRNTEYPKHLHRAGVADDGGPLFVEVHSAEDEAEAIAAGWQREKPAPEGSRRARRPDPESTPAAPARKR